MNNVQEFFQRNINKGARMRLIFKTEGSSGSHLADYEDGGDISAIEELNWPTIFAPEQGDAYLVACKGYCTSHDSYEARQTAVNAHNADERALARVHCLVPAF